VFLGNAEKVFVIYVDHSVGSAINMFLHGTPKPRPQTHDLFADVLTSLGARVERIVINDFTDTVFFARLIIVAENELHERKIIEIAAGPSDSVALGVQAAPPVYVASHVWEAVEDMSIVLKKMQDASGEKDEGYPEF